MLARGLALLDVFRGGEVELSQAELARRANLPKPTAHRLVNQLVRFGALERTRRGVRLGSWLYLMGRNVYPIGLLSAAAQAHLDRLHEYARAYACLSVMLDGEVVDIAFSGSAPWQSLADRMGQRSASSAALRALRAGDPPTPVVVNTQVESQKQPPGQLVSVALAAPVPGATLAAFSLVGPAANVDTRHSVLHLRRSTTAFTRKLTMLTMAKVDEMSTTRSE